LQIRCILYHNIFSSISSFPEETLVMEEFNSSGSVVNGTGSTEVPQSNAEVIRGQIFEVGPRYIKLAYIGEGAYGMVV